MCLVGLSLKLLGEAAQCSLPQAGTRTAHLTSTSPSRPLATTSTLNPHLPPPFQIAGRVARQDNDGAAHRRRPRGVAFGGWVLVAAAAINLAVPVSATFTLPDLAGDGLDSGELGMGFSPLSPPRLSLISRSACDGG